LAKRAQLEQQVLEVRRKFPGMRIIGPNCLGIIVPSIQLNASFAAATPGRAHRVHLAIGRPVYVGARLGHRRGDRFLVLRLVGNMLDVSMGDLIDYFGSATETKSIILYVESISEAREFMSAARAFARTKPIVAYKAGRFTESAAAAASHTGAMAGVDAVYEAAFQRAGIERIFEIEDMFDCAPNSSPGSNRREATAWRSSPTPAAPA
jgi:acetyltransferase